MHIYSSCAKPRVVHRSFYQRARAKANQKHGPELITMRACFVQTFFLSRAVENVEGVSYGARVCVT